MSFQPKAIANRFIDLAVDAGKPVTPMKLQKLVYFAHGWLIGLADEDLINEPIEAWKFGPVIRSLYREFVDWGNEPITTHATDLLIQDDWDVEVHLPRIDDASGAGARAMKLTKRIWDVFGGFSAIQLSNMTHQPGTPWDRVNKMHNGRIPDRTEIPRDFIKDYFSSLASRKSA